ncbi:MULTISPECIES: hypothetical protein [Photobacterium]|uniref:hypothetical protein n=1 Tax=Photobacterium TaxID=657 RepID=UPI000AF94FF1|nr:MULTISPECIES: hypothetical protein [Photobacterium]
MKKFILVLGLIALGGCTVSGPSIKPATIKVPGVVIEGSHGGHCPPGLAKKGRC